jgi:hypothetical protein
VIEPTNWWKTRLVTFIATHTPKCHDMTRLISESMERPLPLRKRLAMRAHYLICVWCERYRDQLKFMRKALRSCPERENRLSLDARKRLKRALERSRESGHQQSD